MNAMWRPASRERSGPASIGVDRIEVDDHAIRIIGEPAIVAARERRGPAGPDVRGSDGNGAPVRINHELLCD
jgi:hypothetical protein